MFKIVAATVLSIAVAIGASFVPKEKTAPEGKSSLPQLPASRAESLMQAGSPPGLPQTFRISFQTSAGENVVTVADYAVFKSPGTHVWRAPTVRYTIDHPSLATFPYTDPSGIFHPALPSRQAVDSRIEVHLHSGIWALVLGTTNACVVGGTGHDRGGFDLAFTPFSFGTVQYSSISVMP